MRVLEFQPDHLALLMEQGGEAFAGAKELLSRPDYGRMLKEHGDAWTLMHRDTVIGCGGIVHEHDHLGTAWTVLNPVASGRHMVIIDRVARRILAHCPKRRIQGTCDPGFEPASRWLKLLGFVYEGRMAKYTPDGRDQLLFARVT